MRFSYTAVNLEGTTVKGTVSAPTSEEAMRQLEAQGLIVQELKTGQGLLDGFSRPRLTPRELIRFYRDLGRMVGAGIPLIEAFKTLEESFERPAARAIVARIRREVEAGDSLSSAMAATKVFPEAHIAAVKAAEASGNLQEALLQLADGEHSVRRLIAEVKGALTYPVMILVMTLAISYGLMTRLVPKILSQLQQVGLEELPTPTKVIVGVSRFIDANGLILLVLLAGAGFAFSLWVKTPQGREAFDAFVLRLPLFGPLVRNVTLVRALQTLSFLLRSGVPIRQALAISGEASGNTLIRSAFDEVRQQVESGQPLSEAMAQHKALFTPMVVAAARIGEQSANLAAPFQENAETLAEDTRERAQLAAKALEPVMLVFLAIVIGAIILSIFMPMYDMLENLKGVRR